MATLFKASEKCNIFYNQGLRDWQDMWNFR